jgi:hypothetical protein
MEFALCGMFSVIMAKHPSFCGEGHWQSLQLSSNSRTLSVTSEADVMMERLYWQVKSKREKPHFVSPAVRPHQGHEAMEARQGLIDIYESSKSRREEILP